MAAKGGAPALVLEFTIEAGVYPEKSTNKQIKAEIKKALRGFGVLDEVRVKKGDEGASCHVFFARVLAKGQALAKALNAGDDASIKLFNSDIPVSRAEGVAGSGGGVTSNTARRKKDKPEGGKGRGKGKGKGKGRGGDKPRSNVCYSFQKGECDRGDDCRFSHAAEGEEDPRGPRPERPPRNSNQVCYQFQRGECDRGENCRFSHDLDAAAEAAPRRAPRRSNAICHDFRRGECERENCRFSHDLNAPDEQPRRGRSNAPCFDFKNGQCERGDACRFSHEIVEEEDDGNGEFVKVAGRGERGARGRGRGRGGARKPKSNVCYDFLKGQCNREECRFSHELPAPAAEEAAPVAE